jgi:hypothetical protein
VSPPAHGDQLPRSVAEFHAWHSRQPERWEFIGGTPRLMAPASMTHSLIKKNITTAFDNALGDGPCVALPDGVEVELAMRLRDRFSNPVIDGTQVQFSTEGGRVQDQCLTVDGDCTVIWNSQNPRPVDGRSALLAFMIGEESFIDVTGNGIYGEAERAAGTLRDQGEPFRDDTESGQFDPGADGFFFDFDESGDWTGPNGRFDGLLCGLHEDKAWCEAHCGKPLAPIGQRGLIVMSGSTAYIEVALQDAGNFDYATPIVPGQDDYSIGDGPLWVRVSDINYNQMACGTEISISSDYGRIITSSTRPVGGGTAPGGSTHVFHFEAENDPGCGALTIEVTTPGGAITELTPITICD